MHNEISMTTSGKKHSPETIAKMRAAHLGKKQSPQHVENNRRSHLGKHPSEETRCKLSALTSGENNPNYGKPMSEEQKSKISRTRIERGVAIGKKNPNYGKPRSSETKTKISNTRIERAVAKGENNPRFGAICSEETLEKMRLVKLGKYDGEKNPMWRGGISFDPYCYKFSDEFKERCRAFQGYECLICGRTESEEGRKLSVHHVDYDKEVCCNDRSPAFAVLCRKHNAMANFYRSRWSHIFHRIIDELWDGKCYYSKDEFENVR